jgi:hypothetical protein
MNVTRFTKTVALLTGALLSGACATSRYTQSRFDALPGVEDRGGSKVSVEVEGLKLDIQTLDRTPEQEATRQLTLRLVFDPRELGYSFDPGQVVLRTADGREWRATGSRYVPLNPNSTFDLSFATTVESETSVELVLGGLARGTTRLEPVSFKLARRRGRSIDRMYWLEAVGYALAVLTYPYGSM